MRVYNLEGIMLSVFEQLDWAPSQSTIAKNRVKEFVDRAMNQLALEAPALFNEEEVRIVVYKDQVPTLAADTLSVAEGSDAWVMTTNSITGTTDAISWEEDRAWGGRSILLKVPSSDPEEWHSNRIRETWSYTDAGGDKFTQLSLETPWDQDRLADTAIEYKLINSEFLIPDDVIEVRSISLMENSTGYPYPLAIIGQTPAEFATFPNQASLQASGPPRSAYRRERQYIDGPRRKVGVEVQVGNAPTVPVWTGPEAAGTFEYLITYAWGRQENMSHPPGPETMVSVSGKDPRMEPYWESAPSPISDQVTSTATTGNIVVHLPNVDHELGFDNTSAYARFRHAGIKKRIYRRRVTADAVAAGGVAPDFGLLAYPHQDAPNRFYLLDEVDGHITEYQDDGSVLPDVRRPFREVHGYQTFRLYPAPDARYELVVRCIRRPLPLQDDSDVPQVPRDAIEAILLRTMAFAYEMMGNAAMAQRKLAEYERAVGYLLKRYGDMRPASRIRRRRIARTKDRSVWRRDLSGVVTNS